MTQKVSELLSVALSLTPDERFELAGRLWESLEPLDSFAEMNDEEIAAELDRRSAELKTDPASGISWEEVQEMR